MLFLTPSSEKSCFGSSRRERKDFSPGSAPPSSVRNLWRRQRGIWDWEITCFIYEDQSFGHKSRFDKLRAVFDAYPGTCTREKVEAYVKALGFTDADIAKFRSIMLED